MDEGWKGRAQQISLLKTKLSRLERDRESGVGSSSTSSNPRFRSSASGASKGVDAKAEEELSSMSQERQLAVEVRSVHTYISYILSCMFVYWFICLSFCVSFCLSMCICVLITAA